MIYAWKYEIAPQLDPYQNDQNPLSHRSSKNSKNINRHIKLPIQNMTRYTGKKFP